MTRSGLITMSMRELDRVKVIEAVVEQRLMPWRAADRLELTTRQIRRLAARVREDGPGRTGVASACAAEQQPAGCGER